MTIHIHGPLMVEELKNGMDAIERHMVRNRRKSIVGSCIDVYDDGNTLVLDII